MNLNYNQRKGLQKIAKRIEDKELLIIQTDKTDCLAAVSVDKYLDLGMKHTASDLEVSLEDFGTTQRLISGHPAAWIKILRVGKKWGHTSRNREICVNKSVSVNPIYVLSKDNKPKSEENYKTRPVMSSHLDNGHVLSVEQFVK